MEKDGEQVNEKVEGIYNQLSRLLIKCDIDQSSDVTQKRMENLLTQTKCPACQGRRLNSKALSCRIEGYNIAELCEMELTRLKEVLLNIHDESGKIIVETLVASLDRMIDIGLPYLSLNREACSLSGGEAQRLKLVRYMGNSLLLFTAVLMHFVIF